MLNGGHNHTIIADYCGQAGIHHTIEPSRDAGGIRQVFSDKFDTVVDGGRFQRQMNGFAGMQSDTGTADCSSERPLIDGYGHIVDIFSDSFKLKPVQTMADAKISI